jgi:nitroreductase
VITTNVNTITVATTGGAPLAGLGNPAPAAAGIHELIRERWSPRAFSSAPVSPERLNVLLEAARWAPSSMNEQPWRFIAANRQDDPEGHARIASTLVPFNAAWASRAPVLMIVAAKTAFTHNGAANHSAYYDVGQAVALLSLQATAFGLAVHQMGGFDRDRDRARLLLGIPEGYEPVVALALGYPGDAGELSPEMRAREMAPRTRRPASERVYGGRWSEPLPPTTESVQ